MTCPDCGHAGHAGRCFFLLDSGVGRYKTATCPCKRRDHDGDSDGAGAAEGSAAGDRSVRRGSDSDVATVDDQIARSGDKVLTEMVRMKGVLDAAFPLLTAFRDRARAKLGDLLMDLEKDEGDGGLGSGRWLNAENP